VDWRGIFWLLVAYGAALVLAALSVLARRESNPPERRAARGRVHLRDDYAALFSDRRFVAVVLAGGLQWAAMMTYMSSSAFLFQQGFGLSPTAYAIIFGAHGALMIGGAQLSARLAGRVPAVRVLRGGVSVLFGVVLVLLASVTLVPSLGLLGFIVPLFAFTTTFGVISPAIQSTALGDHGDRAGAAASLLGATNMVAGAIASPLVGLIGATGPVPIAVLMTVCIAGSFACVLVGFRPRRTLVEV
jgi:DHA1 family bicyclomycin/chloramphenicol resistance-like MFS transporter